MFILDKPYVSDLIIETIKKNSYPLLSSSAKAFNIEKSNEISEEQAAKTYNKETNPKIYSNSENAINWISKNLPHTALPEKINCFKDKIKFRELTASMFPNFFFQGIAYHELATFDATIFPYPIIIKPSVGFFSMGVYKVDSPLEWNKTLNDIHEEMQEVKNLYPLEVMDSKDFIIEECIEGKEFAFDAYYNEQGEVVIVGIYEHLFSSGDDVSDRVYFTSKNIIEKHLEPFTVFLQEIGNKTELKNFPVHAEVRITEDGQIVPIEINPMRFGGWCTTADMTSLAYGLNPYDYFFKSLKPDWNELLKDKDDLVYSIIILNNSTGVESEEIINFDYEKLKSSFNKSMALRKVDWNNYPLFGILFVESPRHKFKEIEEILVSDLREYIVKGPKAY